MEQLKKPTCSLSGFKFAQGQHVPVVCAWCREDAYIQRTYADELGVKMNHDICEYHIAEHIRDASKRAGKAA